MWYLLGTAGVLLVLYAVVDWRTSIRATRIQLELFDFCVKNFESFLKQEPTTTGMIGWLSFPQMGLSLDFRSFRILVITPDGTKKYSYSKLPAIRRRLYDIISRYAFEQQLEKPDTPQISTIPYCPGRTGI